jgi:drug/metabolite transporter (DMT)-like permease
MVAFASNSLLCRVALLQTHIDPASFTLIRIVSGALVLWLIVQLRRGKASGRGNWLSAVVLFAYAAGFSYAYVELTTATGALLLFAAVQATMIGFGIWTGERLRRTQTIGLALAVIGLIGLLLPGIEAPNLFGAVSMLSAGIAWGVYSLRGKAAGDAIKVTAGNFIRAVPIAVAMSLAMFGSATVDGEGACYAIASGALASGIGYSIWYTALPGLKSIHAASVQLGVPVLAAIGGIAFLGEPITWRLLFASLAILGGIALVLSTKRAAR